MRDESEQEFGADPGSDRWAKDLFEQLEQSHDGRCPYPCPFCMGMGALKQVRPEVAEHLVTAGRELMLAARAMLESMAEPRGGRDGPEKIPLD